MLRHNMLRQLVNVWGEFLPGTIYKLNEIVMLEHNIVMPHLRDIPWGGSFSREGQSERSQSKSRYT